MEGRGRSQRGPVKGNTAAMEGLDWWNELELSPPRGADSSLKQWRWVGGICVFVYGWKAGGIGGGGVLNIVHDRGRLGGVYSVLCMAVIV